MQQQNRDSHTMEAETEREFPIELNVRNSMCDSMRRNYLVMYTNEIYVKYSTEYFTLLYISSFLIFWKYSSGNMCAQ